MFAKTLRVGVDLDGVVYDFVSALRRYMTTYMGADPAALPDACCWEFPVNHWGLDWPGFGDLMNRATDAGFLFADGDPYPGAIAALQRIKDAGHTLHIVTDRSSGTDLRAHDNSREWLERVLFPYDTLTFSADKTSVETDVFIEDRDKNYWALTEAGVLTFLQDRPYNRHVETPRRVANLDQFADAVIDLAAQAA